VESGGNNSLFWGAFGRLVECVLIALPIKWIIRSHRWQVSGAIVGSLACLNGASHLPGVGSQPIGTAIEADLVFGRTVDADTAPVKSPHLLEGRKWLSNV